MPKGYPRGKNPEMYGKRKKYARKPRMEAPRVVGAEVFPLSQLTSLQALIELVGKGAVIVVPTFGEQS